VNTTRAVLVALLALMLGAPVAAKEASSEPRCIKGKVLTAFQALTLQKALEWGEYSCGMSSRYADFRSAYKSELAAADEILLKHFGDISTLEAFQFTTATEVAQRSASSIAATCNWISALYDQILAPERIKFSLFLQAEPLAQGHGQNVCGKPTTVIAANRSSQRPISDNVPKPFERECREYGFKKGTSAFSECRMKLADAQQQLALMTRQYELQREMYQQQMAAYNAQQEAIRKERERQRSEALLRLGLGMMNSQSPTFAGGLSDGVAAMYGVPRQPPVAPPTPPNIGNYTVRLPNGNQVYCNYANNYMSCR
jgi:hypothetical protein